MSSSSLQPSSFYSFFSGLGGTTRGSFFQLSDKVDPNKPPGATPLSRAPGGGSNAKGDTPWSTIIDIVTLKSFVFAPNLTWFLIAVLTWQAFPYCSVSKPATGKASASQIYPYDIIIQPSLEKETEPITTWNTSLIPRFLFNLVIMFSYVAFWHVTIYYLKWAKRPFSASPRSPSPKWTHKVLHNMFYTILGILQWSLVEMIFVQCYRKGQLPIHKVDNTLSSWTSLIFWCLAVPVIRDIHFYLSHRLLHLQFLYKYIHSVHHRNTTEIEPFSGLCMHPLEHLYYLSCYGPLLLAAHHPFILYWMGIHVCLSPAAAHSGYEDHFSASLYHYCHHRYYDCNYAGGIPFDKWFGTYREKLQPQHTMHQKESDNNTTDAKATLLGRPEHFLFNLLTGGIMLGIFIWSPVFLQQQENAAFLLLHGMALLLTTCPIWMAAGFYYLVDNSRTKKSHLLAPFDKDSLLSQLVHIGGGIVWCVLPAYYLMKLYLQAAID